MNWIFRKKVPKKDMLYIRDIVDEFLENPNIKKLIDPVLGEYFLIDLDKKVNIFISSSEVKISNHKFLYKKSVPLYFSELLCKKVASKIGEETQETKKELFENEVDLLRKILKDENKS